jgi:CDP-diacylglycerol--glycerol-3-phosphate 3-phosphatidyltransferase
MAMLAALVLSLSLIVSYIKARAESLGFACNVGIAERPERVIVLGIALLLGHAEAGLWVLVAGTAITVVQRHPGRLAAIRRRAGHRQVIPNSQAASRRWLTAWKLVRKLPEPLAFALGRAGGVVYHRLDRGRRRP